jgi:DNA-binding MarR family transcriptional regulator
VRERDGNRGGAEPGGLDAVDGAILRTLLGAGPAYLTVPDLRRLTGIGLPALTVRVSRLEQLGYVWRLPDGTTGLHCSYRLSAAGAAYARTPPTGS